MEFIGGGRIARPSMAESELTVLEFPGLQLDPVLKRDYWPVKICEVLRNNTEFLE